MKDRREHTPPSASRLGQASLCLLLQVLLSLSVSAQTAVTSPDETRRNAVVTVQTVLREAGNDEVTANGTWDDSTAKALYSFVRELQKDRVWGKGWRRRTDGIYSDAFAKHLRAKIDALADADDLRAFVDALDYLKSQRIYTSPTRAEVVKWFPPKTAPRAVAVTPSRGLGEGSSGSAPSGAGRVMLLSFANGFLWEWGDEILCNKTASDPRGCKEESKALLQYYLDEHPWYVIIPNFIGNYLCLTGMLVIMFARFAGRGMRIRTAFKYGFFAEILESIVRATGEISTFGSLDVKGLFMMTLIAGFVTGISAAIATRRR